ncbi:MAG: MarR family transcriptional regulator [Acidimicrobiales bacterium]
MKTDPRLAVLHGLKLTGRALPDGLAERSGIGVAQIEAALSELADAGLVERRDGCLSGWSLSGSGRRAHVAALEAERAAGHTGEQLRRAYVTFLGPNAEFKALCTAWQLRPVGQRLIPNDHRDRAYDAALIDQLSALHDELVAIIVPLAETIDRFATYRPRFAAAMTSLRGGDLDALTRPLSGSYHDVWMELHQDLLDSLGLARSDADGRSRPPSERPLGGELQGDPPPP